MKKELQYLQNRLLACYDSGEAVAIARWIFESRFHYTRLDYCLDKDRNFSKEEREDFENIVSRLLENEPVQPHAAVHQGRGSTFPYSATSSGRQALTTHNK